MLIDLRRHLTRNMHPIAEFIAREPGMVARLLAAHVDDGRGRCRVCSNSAQARRAPWPCLIHLYAAQAKDARRRDDSTPRRT